MDEGEGRMSEVPQKERKWQKVRWLMSEGGGLMFGPAERKEMAERLKSSVF